ncbi:hypothetical protein [Corynebacterium provencense]|uniref:hypothetical protein n=1 Tax=Corynebacterium provencense TaxID=1737425 RepID=UPI00082FB1F9|nr:hypothetical protein [Corynebacterium provencense]
MNYRAWINALIGTDTLRVASAKIGLSHSTITRQLSRGTLTPTAVISLCRAYGRSPVDGLVETGYLRAEETEGVGVPRALVAATNQELLDEVLRRSDPEARTLFGLDDDLINPAPEGQHAGGTGGTGRQGRQGRQGKQPVTDRDDGTVVSWRPHPHAADGSPDEDEGRADAGSDPLH